MAAVREQLLAAQPPEKREHLSACLAKLMADVGPALDAKNRDKFTQNLTVVRHEYRSRV
jgi:exportin-7